MNKIIACIDGSSLQTAVCDAAIWASQRLGKSLMLLHTIEKQQQHGADDMTGAIGLGAQSNLLEEMARLDQQKGKIALELGKNILASALEQAQAQDLSDIETKQRHGDLLEALVELESEARLMVVGRRGQGHTEDFKALGSHIESLIRQVHTPVMILPSEFTPPQSFMLAYDGRETADIALERIVQGGLLEGLTCHLVMVKSSRPQQDEKLQAAAKRLESHGFQAVTKVIESSTSTISTALSAYQQEQDIGLMVMGAFGHSKMRQLILGSTTLKMIESSQVPLMVLR